MLFRSCTSSKFRNKIDEKLGIYWRVEFNLQNYEFPINREDKNHNDRTAVLVLLYGECVSGRWLALAAWPIIGSEPRRVRGAARLPF